MKIKVTARPARDTTHRESCVPEFKHLLRRTKGAQAACRSAPRKARRRAPLPPSFDNSICRSGLAGH